MATSAKGKGKKSAKRAPARETKAVQGAKKQMWAVILFASGILLGALTFIQGDKLWKGIHNLLFGMLGLSTYFLAPLLIYVAVIAAMDRPLSSIKAKLWQVLLLIAVVSGAFQIFGPGRPAQANFVDNVVYLYKQGASPQGGGLIGALIALPLLSLFEKTGASIIIVLLIFVFVMVITGSTLIGLVRAARRPVEGLEEAYAERVVERQERKVEQPVKPVKKRGRKAAPAPEPPPPVNLPASGQPERFAAFDVDISGDTMVEMSSQSELGESPVEIITSQELRREQPEAAPVTEAPPAHPLEDDILKAEQQEISQIVDRFMAPPVAEETPPWEELPPEPVTAPLFDVVAPVEQSYPVSGPETGMALEHEPMQETMPVLAREPAPEMVPVLDTEPEPEVEKAIVFPTVTPPAPPPPQYQFPPLTLLKMGMGPSSGDVSEELKNNAQTLVDTLKSFGVQTRIIDICRGPAVTRYELQPSAGVKISKITGLADDIALNLASAGIRIEAPIPNKAAVGIEVPNKNVSMVTIRELIEAPEFQSDQGSLTVAMGRDIAGNITLADIGRMPHVLIAGATGSGKSVCINSIIMSLLYKYSPEEVKLLMVDPKVVELGVYNGIPHLLVPVVTDPKKAAGALGWAVAEMMERYKTFAANGVKDLAGYNRLAQTREELPSMPKIVIIIDELADLMMAAPNEVEDSICRLAQMARAAGMHLVIATQRPSVDVITGVIKANIPSRVAFAVSSQVDSRTILDMGGAEKLLGRGDMLFYPVGLSKPMRVQGCFVTENEVESVVSFIKDSANATYDDNIMEDIDRLSVVGKGKGKGGAANDGGGFEEEDEMLPLAIECVVEAGQASTSQLQRRLKLGYARAARIIDQLEEKGIVGPFEGSKPRQVMISKERWMEMKLSGAEESVLKANTTPGEPDPVIPPEKGGVKPRPDEFEFADL